MEGKISSPQERPTRCSACGQLFKSESEIRNHANNGSCPGPVATYNCPHCHKCFFKKVVLKNHIMTHTGERPYNCTVCGQKFRRSHHRKRHMEGVHHVSPKSMKRGKRASPETVDSGDDRSERQAELPKTIETGGDKKSVAKVPKSASVIGTNGTSNKKAGRHLNNNAIKNSSHSDIIKPQESTRSSKSTSPQTSWNNQNGTKNSNFQENHHLYNNNNALHNVASIQPAGIVNNLGGYITVPPQFSSAKQSSVLNIPLQNVTQMFTVQGQLGDIFPMMSAMINSNNTHSAFPAASAPNFGPTIFGQETNANSLIETSVSFPEITNAWSNMMDDDQHPYKCFLCSHKFSNQCDLDTHFREHVVKEDVANGDS